MSTSICMSRRQNCGEKERWHHIGQRINAWCAWNQHSRRSTRSVRIISDVLTDVEQRIEESQRIRQQYPDRVPVICEKAEKTDIPNISKKKYLVPGDLTVGQFVYVIRKRIKLSPDKAIFIFVESVLPATSASMNDIYAEYKDEDGFLYLWYVIILTYHKNSYSGENTLYVCVCARSR